MPDDYDYTANDRAGSVPFDDADDFCLPNVPALDRTAEEIADENTFRDIPAGEHVVLLKGFEAPVLAAHKVLLNGAPDCYESYTVRLKFCLPDDPMATMEDWVRLPPANPSQVKAYQFGVAESKDGRYDGKAGFEAHKFYVLMGALGFPYHRGGNLPPAALRLGNWKNRLVKVTVQPGGTYVGRDGKEREGRCRPKLFSYKAVDGSGRTPLDATIAGARVRISETRRADDLRQRTESPAMAAAAVEDRSDLDNI